jgi:phage portal protein BeeE
MSKPKSKTSTITVEGATTSGYVAPLSPTLNIDFRAGDELAELPKGSLTAFEGTPIPPPVSMLACIEYRMSNPWLAAVGLILADAISTADFTLEPREFDLAGNALGEKPGQRQVDERQYALGMAWLSRDDMALDGVSNLDFAAFRRAAAQHLDQTGNLFVEVLRDKAANGPRQLSLLLPQYVMYVLAKEDKKERLYQLDPYRGEAWFVRFGTRAKGQKDSREFLHQRLSNTVSNIYGLPPWIEARESVDLDNAHRRYLKGFFGNHAAPRWLIHITQDPTWVGDEVQQADLEKIESLVKNYLSANAGEMAGRSLILRYPGGIIVKADPMDAKLEDPTFPNTAKNARDEILAVRHTSLIDLGLPEGGYRATAETQSDNFRKVVLEPFAAPIVALVNRLLHSPAPYGLGITDYDLALEFLDVEALLQRMKTLIEATGVPILSPDEGRSIAGYEPKGDDTLYMPSNMVPGMTEQPSTPNDDSAPRPTVLPLETPDQ